MTCTGAPLKTAHATLSTHAGRMCMMEPSTVITSLRRYYRGTRSCTRRYGMRYHESSMHRGSRMKPLRPPRPRNIVHPAASPSRPQAHVKSIAPHAVKPNASTGELRQNADADNRRRLINSQTWPFWGSETLINQALAGIKIKTPYTC